MINNSITIAVDGTKYEGWSSVSVTRSIETFCNSFSFTSSQVSMDRQFPIKVGQKCAIYVNNVQVIYGWVEKLVIRDSAESAESGTHSISIVGRDRTCDILDSTAASLNFTPPISLENLTRKILSDLGLSDIEVINNYKLAKLTSTESTEVGISYYDFLQYFAKKLQVIPITTNDGNIEFIRAGTQVYDTILSKNIDDPNTIVSSIMTLDFTARFHNYEIVGQNDYSILGVPIDDDSASIVANAVDTDIRPSRQYTFSAEDGQASKEDSQLRVNWEANFRRGQSFIYEVTVPYFKPALDDGIWQPNKLVRVNDTINDIKSILLITSVEYSQSVLENQGSLVKMKLLTSDAFTAEVNRNKKKKKDNKEADDYQILGVPEP